MKVLAILGSRCPSGQTANAAKAFLKGVEEGGGPTDMAFLPGMEIEPSVGRQRHISVLVAHLRYGFGPDPEAASQAARLIEQSRRPIIIAGEIAALVSSAPEIESVAVAPPGFINFYDLPLGICKVDINFTMVFSNSCKQFMFRAVKLGLII